MFPGPSRQSDDVPQAIVFVHNLGIAHRVSDSLYVSASPLTIDKDLCKSNYVVQWHPESLSTMRVPLSRSRVFLTGFKMAHEFPPDMPSEKRMLTGPPIDDYQRPIPPEIACGKPYDPFKADVWQLAESFSDFKVRRSCKPDL